MGRDRSQGWVHAKRSGHEFEDAFARHVLEPASKERKALISFLQKAGIDQHPVSADGRIGRARVEDWTGQGRTTPKRDVTVVLDGGRQLGISLKKPSTRSGQAFLCQYDRFSACVGSRSAGVTKPDGVDWVFHGVLGLTGGKNIASWQPGIKFHSPLRKTHGVSYEEYQNRLYFSTVRSECPDKWCEFIDWFRGNLGVITDMALASGFCGTAGHSDIIYLGCEGAFVWTAALVAESRDRAALAAPSTGGRFPGSTLELPWGFLQVHRPGKKSGPFQLQFHWESKAEAWRAAIGKPPIRARG